MKRRTLLASLSALSVSLGLSIGSGAFTSVSGDRRLEIQTSDDNNALLTLKQEGGTKSVESGSPEQVEFRFPSLEQKFEYMKETGDSLGLGTDSVYEFAADDEDGLLRIMNQGTQTVDVYSKFDSQHSLNIELFDVQDSSRTALRDENANLGTGDHVDVGFRIDTSGASVGQFDETLTIVAEQPDD